MKLLSWYGKKLNFAQYHKVWILRLSRTPPYKKQLVFNKEEKEAFRKIVIKRKHVFLPVSCYLHSRVRSVRRWKVPKNFAFQ